MDYGDMYNLLSKLGRRGMPYARFKAAIHSMGFRLDDAEMFNLFAELDINQDAVLDWGEFRGGVLSIVKDRMPESILLKLVLSKMDVIKKVTVVILGMSFLFAF